MAIAEFKFFSESLSMNTTVNVIMPQKKVKGEIGLNYTENSNEKKCLYLLHGLSDDGSAWTRRTSIERYALNYGINIVMPVADRSFYTDMKYGLKYYTYIAKELPEVIHNYFNLSQKREDTYIAGLSMGGYGALKMALREGNYCAAAGLSTVADIKGMTDTFKNDYINAFGEDINIPDEDDLFYLAKKHNNDEIKPRIFMAVGKDDFMYEHNVELSKTFKSLDYDYTYIEDEGAHTWEFWDKYIQDLLKWMFE